MKHVFIAAATLFYLFFSCFAIAADDPDTITIIGKSITNDEKINRSTGSVEVIDMAVETKKFTTVSEVLSERSGIQVKRLGSPGYQSFISIRGSNVNQVVIYIDGVPLNDSAFGEVNMEDIPVDNIAYIEIYRGFTPLRFNISAIGGVINIVTKTGDTQKDAAKNRLAAGYGSSHTIKTVFSRYRKIKNFNYMIFLNRVSSNGDFTFKNDNGTPVQNISDDRIEKRKNNDHESYAANFKSGYTFSSCQLLFSHDFFYKDHGIPGLNNNTVSHARLKTIRNISDLSVKIPGLFSKNSRAHLRVFVNIRNDQYQDPEDEIGLGNKKQDSTFSAFGSQFFTEYNCPGWNQTFSLLIAPQFEQYEQKTVDFSGKSETSPEQTRKKLNMGIEDELSILHDKLLIVPNLRYDIWQDDFYIENSPYLNENGVSDKSEYHKLSYKFGCKYYFYKKKDKEVSVKTNYAHAYRIPTFTELFGDRGPILGNPELKNEKSDNFDAGLAVSFNSTGIINSFSFSYSYFFNTIENIIIFIHNSQNTIIAHNISKAENTGHELAMSLNMFKSLYIQGNYTLQFPMDKSEIPYYNNNYLPHRPVHELFASVKYTFAFFTLCYEYNYTGANFRDRANSEFYYIKQRTYHNLQAAVTPVKSIQFTFEIKNILNNYTRDKIGYPLPGRSYYATLAYSF